MKKTYQPTKMEIVPVQLGILMIPTVSPTEPNFLPERHWVPGRGKSYRPPHK